MTIEDVAREQIISTIDRVHGQVLSDIALRLSTLTVNGNARRFLVCRMGSTGSTWLAKLLNSHPEVNCSHEGHMPLVYPVTQCTGEDVMKFIEYFAWDSKHDAYQVLGDVGSVWMGHLPHLRSFTSALLLRHPARILRTRLSTHSTDQSFSAIPADSRRCIRELWGIDITLYEPIDRIFLHDAFTYASHLWGLDKVDFAIRIEEMQNPEYCHEALGALTGLAYPSELVELAINRRVNQRTAGVLSIREIVAEFSARQRDWYRVILAGVLPGLRYSLFDDVGPVRTQVVSRRHLEH